jgi:hypothetical protein
VKFALAGELHNKNRVFTRQPHQHKQRNLREDVFVAAGVHHPANGKQQAQRHDENNSERQAETLVQRGQHQHHQQRAQRIHQHRRIAGENLLIGQFGPLVGDAARQGLAQDLLHFCPRLARAHAGRRRAVDVG